ncbi:hypothetical protein BKA62DRAFT_668868 [Auriculariales sp. MPI-PUGE-AT-0066]|nr:hypothetical protein BKA62DRAFT_668868 [Auriculariales sp. MPI-PUGE-AT-0066]
MPTSSAWALVVSILLLAGFFNQFTLAAPLRALSFISLRNITVDNANPLLQYDPPVCGTPFTVKDPFSLDAGACAGTWLDVRNSGFSNGSVMTATGISDRFKNVSPSVSFHFAGSAITWRTTSYPSGRGGLASVQLDNALPVLVNTSSLLPGDQIVFNVVGFEAKNLDPDIAHTITIKLVPQPVTDVNAPLHMLDIDAFEYTERTARGLWQPSSPIADCCRRPPPPLLRSSTVASSGPSTTTPASEPSPTRVKSAAFTGALIALCVCGGLVVVVMVAIAVLTFVRRRRRSSAAARGPHAPLPGTTADAARQRDEGQTITIRPTNGFDRSHGRGQSLVSPLMTEHVLSTDTIRSSGYVYG